MRHLARLLCASLVASLPPVVAQTTQAAGTYKITEGSVCRQFSSAVARIYTSAPGANDSPSIEGKIENETEQKITGVGFEIRPTSPSGCNAPLIQSVHLSKTPHHAGGRKSFCIDQMRAGRPDHVLSLPDLARRRVPAL